MTTKIEWTDETWNPVTGCTKISAGCKNCYAERMARRLAGRHGYPEAPHHFDVTLRHDRLEEPLSWRKPRMVFVCSMSDLFHPDVPFEFIDEVFAAICATPRHTYQILTKRPERMVEWHLWTDLLDYFPNVWVGVTVENQENCRRVDHLLEIDAVVRFVSCEPLIGSLDLGLRNWPEIMLLDWVIAGGESGHGARLPQPDWFRLLRDDCEIAGVPFFFKQWGGPHHNGWVIDGKTYQGETLDGEIIQQFPTLPEPTEMPL